MDVRSLEVEVLTTNQKNCVLCVIVFWGTCLAVVGTAVLGHSTLSINKEAVSAALLRQGCLVSLSDESVQLRLLTADGLHKLNTDT